MTGAERGTNCFGSSVGLEHLLYTERVVGSNPTRSTKETKVMIKCLVLDQSYTPRSIINSDRAFVIVYKGNAEVVHNHPESFQLVDSSLDIKKPSIIRVPNYIRHGHQKVPLTRANIFKRDNYKCVYCGEHHRGAMTLDHVVPRSKGGEDSFENLVTCCMPCNFEKDDLTVEEWGRKHPNPKRPHYLMLMKSTKIIYDEWKTYLFS